MVPSHYLKQCWITVNWTLRNKRQWNFNRNSNIYIQENALEHVVCKMESISSRRQWVKHNSACNIRTCLCAHTTEPSSFQEPPRRSTRTIRRIWKNRRPRNADVANTWPLLPRHRITILADITTISAMIRIQYPMNEEYASGKKIKKSWWPHDMETLSPLLALCEGNPIVTDVFTSQKDNNLELWGISLDKLFKKQLSWWFEMLKWHHYNGNMSEENTSGNKTEICFNSLRLRQDGRLFADDTFKRIFWNDNIRISTKNSLKFVLKGVINIIPALVLIMAWGRPGDKPLSEPMLVRSLTHICVTRPQWVNKVSKCSLEMKMFIITII